MFNGNISANEELNRQAITSYPIIGFISISIVAPLVEEMLFRYGLRKVTGKTKYFPLITAILFGGVHTLAGIGLSLRNFYLYYLMVHLDMLLVIYTIKAIISYLL